jgi:hypothetical protein
MNRNVALSAALTFASIVATAQAAPLAYVASDGNDRAGCTLVRPCRTFQAAHDAVDARGGIVALDTADYGPLTIGKSVSVVGNAGIVAGITVLSGNGVTIATAGVDVVLRNLHIAGAGGARGVDMSAGRSLTLENCVVANLAGDGIRITAGEAASIVDTVTRGNGGHGAYLGSGHTTVANSRFMANAGSGLYLEAAAAAGVSASVADSVASENGNRGFSARAATNSTRMSLVRATASRNTGAGFANELLSNNPDAKMSIANSMSTGNAIGFFSTITALITNSLIYSAGNNVVMFNGVDVDGIVAAMPAN